MAQLYSGCTLPGLMAQQLIVQCPSCTLRFSLSSTFIYPNRWPHNVTYSQTSNFRYTQSFIQHPSPQSGVRPAFYVPTLSGCHVFGVNQEHQKMTNSTNSKQYASQDAVDMNDMIVRRIRDIVIDILNSAMCEYGITVHHLMVLVKQSCANYNIILPSSIMDDFKKFLRYKMTDYVEVEDDLCRYRRPTLFVQEESISSMSVCESISSRPKTPPAALVPWQALQRKNDLTKIKEKWKKIFIGDLKELIRYLRMVDNYFHENDGKFTLTEFKEVFGELSKRWEFCDIDLVEMDIINVVHDIGLNEEPVLIVNPIIREMEFPEVAELAKQIYNLLSKLLQSVNSVKVEVIVRTVNFGINSSKKISEKYALLWEVLSDSQFQDIFVVDILQKQNKERGFDVMVRLNPNLDLPRIFAE